QAQEAGHRLTMQARLPQEPIPCGKPTPIRSTAPCGSGHGRDPPTPDRPPTTFAAPARPTTPFGKAIPAKPPHLAQSAKPPQSAHPETRRKPDLRNKSHSKSKPATKVTFHVTLNQQTATFRHLLLHRASPNP